MLWGEISRTITIKVPVKIVYEFLKEYQSLNWVERYCKDLTKDLLTEYSIVNDVPNKELSFTSSKWGTKYDIKFILREIDNKTTEITCHLKYRLTFNLFARAGMIQIIGTLIALERGYLKGRAALTQPVGDEALQTNPESH